MAIQENQYFRGQIADVIARKMGGRQIIQSRPSAAIRQSAQTKAASEGFGQLSTHGRLIRRAFQGLHMGFTDAQMHNRLIRQLARVVRAQGALQPSIDTILHGDLSRLNDFQFNEECHLHDFLFFEPGVAMDEDSILTISLPELSAQRNFRIPDGCGHILLVLEVTVLNFESETRNAIGEIEVEVPLYGTDRIRPSQEFTFDCGAEGDAVLVGMSAMYFSNSGSRRYLLNNKELHPSGIIAADLLK